MAACQTGQRDGNHHNIFCGLTCPPIFCGRSVLRQHRVTYPCVYPKDKQQLAIAAITGQPVGDPLINFTKDLQKINHPLHDFV